MRQCARERIFACVRVILARRLIREGLARCCAELWRPLKVRSIHSSHPSSGVLKHPIDLHGTDVIAHESEALWADLTTCWRESRVAATSERDNEGSDTQKFATIGRQSRAGRQKPTCVNALSYPSSPVKSTTTAGCFALLLSIVAWREGATSSPVRSTTTGPAILQHAPGSAPDPLKAHYLARSCQSPRKALKGHMGRNTLLATKTGQEVSSTK